MFSIATIKTEPKMICNTIAHCQFEDYEKLAAACSGDDDVHVHRFLRKSGVSHEDALASS